MADVVDPTLLVMDDNEMNLTVTVTGEATHDVERTKTVPDSVKYWDNILAKMDSPAKELMIPFDLDMPKENETLFPTSKKGSKIAVIKGPTRKYERDSFKDGQALLVNDNQSKYLGTVVDGRKNGFGISYEADGVRYVGSH